MDLGYYFSFSDARFQFEGKFKNKHRNKETKMKRTAQEPEPNTKKQSLASLNDSEKQESAKAASVSKSNLMSLESVYDKLVFMAVRNSRGAYVLPSTENWFGPVKLERIIFDTSCNSMLGYLQPGDVQQLNHLYAQQKIWIWELTGAAPGVYGWCLTISSVFDTIEWNLGKDLFDPKDRPPLNRLRFGISSLDAKELLLLNKWEVGTKEHQALTAIARSNVEPRSHALIGIDLLDPLHWFGVKPLTVGPHIMVGLTTFEDKNYLISSKTSATLRLIAEALINSNPLYNKQLRVLAENDFEGLVMQDEFIPKDFRD